MGDCKRIMLSGKDPAIFLRRLAQPSTIESFAKGLGKEAQWGAECDVTQELGKGEKSTFAEGPEQRHLPARISNSATPALHAATATGGDERLRKVVESRTVENHPRPEVVILESGHLSIASSIDA